MADFEYNDASARSAVNQFIQLGDELGSLVNGLAHELSSDSPWSQDKIGSAFESGFNPHRSNAIANAQDLAKRVQSFGPVLKNAADSTTRADHSGDA